MSTKDLNEFNLACAIVHTSAVPEGLEVWTNIDMAKTSQFRGDVAVALVGNSRMVPPGFANSYISQEERLMRMINAAQNEGKVTYRIAIQEDGTVSTDDYSFISGFTSELAPVYESVDKLPQWVQTKLAVLMLFDPDKPPMKEVENIGLRISKDVFWVFNGELASHG